MQPQLSDCKVQLADSFKVYPVRLQKISAPMELRHLFFQGIKGNQKVEIILIFHILFPQIVSTIQISGEITREDNQVSLLARVILCHELRSHTALAVELQTVSVPMHR